MKMRMGNRIEDEDGEEAMNYEDGRLTWMT